MSIAMYLKHFRTRNHNFHLCFQDIIKKEKEKEREKERERSIVYHLKITIY